jgi:hypothetical protein
MRLTCPSAMLRFSRKVQPVVQAPRAVPDDRHRDFPSKGKACSIIRPPTERKMKQTMGRSREKPAKLHAFKRLAETVEAASWELKTEWKPRPAAEKAEYEEALLAEAQSLKPRLDRAAFQWISEGTFPSLTPRETFFLQLRFIGAWQLLYQIETENGATIFRTTAKSQRQFLGWLLTTWGHDVGMIEGLDRVATSWEAQENMARRKDEQHGGG